MNLLFDIGTFVEKCFGKSVRFEAIEKITIGGACLVRRVLSTKHQLPDSFPYMIEKEYGEEIALDFEHYVAGETDQ